MAPGFAPARPGVTRLLSVRQPLTQATQREVVPMKDRHALLPRNGWTLGAADTLAALGYWLGFFATLGADILGDVMRALRARVTRIGGLRHGEGRPS